MNTVNLPRAAVAILKGIDLGQAPITGVQPSTQLDLIENRRSKEKP
jgi:hypothetical protein